VSSRLYDGSGSIKMVLTKDITSRVLQKSLSELILLASQPIPSNGKFQTSMCNMKIPETIEVVDILGVFGVNAQIEVETNQNLEYFSHLLYSLCHYLYCF
jgi:hypothetical protein